MSTNSSEDLLDAVIAAYLEAEATGGAPDRQQLLARHPELASGLRSFFADHDRMRGWKPSVPPCPLGANRYFGDYELLEEVGRGGMGVVYRCHQVTVNRTVALKMILSGPIASTVDVDRFRAEAEAAAQLDHPNVVPLYEVGQHDGQHYFSMKFVEGRSLAQSIADAEWSAAGKGAQRRAASLMATVARAVHHAHQRGILHRDLKPSNILLDAEGQPHVTDFGLARRLDADRRLTPSNGIVGTPSHMAPEQARADKGLTTAADVYSLGAILYELLTGQPPFKGDTPLDTLLQVMEKDPRPLRSLHVNIDRDLELICLRCLDKDPRRRFDSAAALADELQRWLNHEPIVTRPTGRVERILKWARRRPALAALLLSLVVGTTASTVFAVRATLSEWRADRKAEEAEQALDRVVDTFADNFSHAIGYQPSYYLGPGYERETLWMLASSPEGPVRIRYLEKALATPEAAERLTRRTEEAVNAAVGLDTARKEQPLRLVRSRLRDDDENLWVRAACARAVIALGEVDPELAPRATRALTEAMLASRYPIDPTPLFDDLFAWAPGWDQDSAAIVLKSLLHEDSKMRLHALVNRDPKLIVALAPRLSARDAETLAEAILGALDIRSYQKALLRELPLFQAMLASLTPENSAVLGQKVLDNIKATRDRAGSEEALTSLTGGLRVLGDKMDPVVARSLAQAARDDVLPRKPTSGNNQYALALVRARTHIATLLPDDEAGRIALEFLDQVVHEGKPRQAIDAVYAEGVNTLLARLSERQALAVALRCADLLISKLFDAGTSNELAGCFETALSHSDREEARRLATSYAEGILKQVNKAQDQYVISHLVQVLTLLGEYVGEEEAARLASRALPKVLDALARPGNSMMQHYTITALKGLVPRLTRDETARAAAVVTQAMSAAIEGGYSRGWHGTLPGLASLFHALADKLDPAEAVRLLGSIPVKIAEAIQGPGLPSLLAEAFSPVAAHLNREEANALARAAGESLAQRVSDTKLDQTTRQERAKALGAVVEHMNERDVARIAPTVTPFVVELLKKGPHADDPQVRIARSLRKLLAGLGESEANQISYRAVAILLEDVWIPPGQSRNYAEQAFLQFADQVKGPTLVELLKDPSCVRERRAILLRELGRRGGQSFTNLWDFVAWAERNAPELDLRTPPRDPRLEN